jgi:hypothetical protein
MEPNPVETDGPGPLGVQTKPPTTTPSAVVAGRGDEYEDDDEQTEEEKEYWRSCIYFWVGVFFLCLVMLYTFNKIRDAMDAELRRAGATPCHSATASPDSAPTPPF